MYSPVEEQKLTYKLAPRRRMDGVRATIVEKTMRKMKIEKPKKRNSKKMFKRLLDLSVIKSSPKASRFSLKGSRTPQPLNNSFNSRTPQSRFNPRIKTPESALQKKRVARIDFKNWTPNLRGRKLELPKANQKFTTYLKSNFIRPGEEKVNSAIKKKQKRLEDLKTEAASNRKISN